MEEKNYIKANKAISRLHKKARNSIKSDKCLLCGEKCSSFCNSHSVPRFVLSYISHNGKIITQDTISIRNSIKESGINSAWTFHNICPNCDSRFFQDYENEKNLIEKPTTQILAQIALKSDLMMFYKYSIDRAVDDDSLYNRIIASGIEFKKEEDDLNVRDVSWSLRRDKKITEKGLKSGYTCVFYKILDYSVPIAFQTLIYLHKSIDGKTIINPLFDYSKNIIMKPLHICVFPLDNKTVIYVFHHRDDRNYTPFDRQFQRLSYDEKLEYINYLIFKYSEHCLFSPKIDVSVLLDRNLKKLMNESADSASAFVPFRDLFTCKKLVSPKDIPNFLKIKL